MSYTIDDIKLGSVWVARDKLIVGYVIVIDIIKNNETIFYDWYGCEMITTGCANSLSGFVHYYQPNVTLGDPCIQKIEESFDKMRETF